MKRLNKFLLVAMLMISLTPVNVMAKSYKCIASGCNNTCYGSSIYCSKHECKRSGCTSKGTNNGYCNSHKTKSTTTTKKNTTSKSKYSSTSKSKKKSYYDSYDQGYEDVWLDDDYDWDRYQNDWSYSLGVDDALDDYGWDW